ncbi:hypothetical protein [Mycoplasma sp. 392]
MVLLIVIFILKAISPTDNQIAERFPNLPDTISIENLKALGDFSMFNYLGRASNAAIRFACLIELFIEMLALFWIGLKGFKNFLVKLSPKSRQLKAKQELETYETIVKKLELGLRLTRYERKQKAKLEKVYKTQKGGE